MRHDVLGDIIVEKAEKWMKNAERHRLRGDEHVKAGHPDRASKSYQKAERNIAHATAELKRLSGWNRGVKIG